MTTGYYRFGDDGTILKKATDFIRMDLLHTGHKKQNSLSSYDEDNNNDNDNSDVVREKIEDNSDYFGDGNLEATRANTVHYKNFVNNNLHDPPRYVPVEKMYKHLIMIGFFLSKCSYTVLITLVSITNQQTITL